MGMGEKSKELPMQNLDLRGTQMEQWKTPHHVSLAIQKKFKTKINWAPSTLPFEIIPWIFNNPSPCQIGSQKIKEDYMMIWKLHMGCYKAEDSSYWKDCPRDIKCIRSFLGHVGFYRRFIKYFSKTSRPLANLLQKDISFVLDEDSKEAFEVLKKALITAPTVQPPDWSLPFEIMVMLVILLLELF